MVAGRARISGADLPRRIGGWIVGNDLRFDRSGLRHALPPLLSRDFTTLARSTVTIGNLRHPQTISSQSTFLETCNMTVTLAEAHRLLGGWNGAAATRHSCSLAEGRRRCGLSIRTATCGPTGWCRPNGGNHGTRTGCRSPARISGRIPVRQRTGSVSSDRGVSRLAGGTSGPRAVASWTNRVIAGRAGHVRSP